MMTYVLIIAELAMTVAILIGLYRLARGPHVLDRVMAFDLITTCAVGLIVLLSIQWGTPLYLELILIVSLLGFLTTVAFVFYLNRTRNDDATTQDGGRRTEGGSLRSGNPNTDISSP